LAKDFDDEHAAAMERYDRLATAYAEGGQKFSLLVIGNLILVNGGALVALSNAVFSRDVFSVHLVLLPAGLYVLGLLLALACGYAAYINSQSFVAIQWERQSQETWNIAARRLSKEAAERSLAADIPGFMADGSSLEMFLAAAKETIDASKAREQRFNTNVKRSFVAAQLVGVGAAVAFASGCIFLLFVPIAVSSGVPQP